MNLNTIIAIFLKVQKTAQLAMFIKVHEVFWDVRPS